MLRLHIEVDEKAWEKLMWALEHEEPIKFEPDPEVEEWIRTLNDPKKMEERLNELKQFLKRAMEAERLNEK